MKKCRNNIKFKNLIKNLFYISFDIIFFYSCSNSQFIIIQLAYKNRNAYLHVLELHVFFYIEMILFVLFSVGIISSQISLRSTGALHSVVARCSDTTYHTYWAFSLICLEQNLLFANAMTKRTAITSTAEIPTKIPITIGRFKSCMIF